MDTGNPDERQIVFQRKFLGITPIEWLVISFIILVLIILLLPALYPKGSHGSRGQCTNNLKSLALALYNYHDAYGSFPPAYIADAKGKPMHSWRVLILPYLGEEAPEIYQKYRFHEPWDGPNNRKLHSETVLAYLCPSHRTEERDQNWTNYVAVVSSQTAWPGARPLKLEEITDDQEQTILLVEMKNSGIHWMDPRDLNFDEMSFQVNDPAGNSIGSWHPYPRNDRWFSKGRIRPFVQVANVDASVSVLHEEISPETLKALLTIRGGEKIDPAELEW